MTGPSPSPSRIARWAPLAAAALAVAAFAAALPTPYSNVDDYNVRAFAGRFWEGFAATAWERGAGRFRPLYWLLEGALGALGGATGTALHLGRLAFLAGAVALQMRVSAALGAGPVAGAVLALLVNWSYPGLEVWTRGGPAEAFAQPLALGCTLLLLRSRSWVGVAAAAAAGLAASLVKESYAGWTAAAMAAFVLSRALRRRWDAAAWTAVAGIAVQFLPALLARAGTLRWSESYVKLALATGAGTPWETARRILDLNGIVLAMALVAAIPMARRLRRQGLPDWPLEDLLVLVVAVATTAETLAVWSVVPRYQLPMATALALFAARGLGAAGLPDWLRPGSGARRLLAAGLLVGVASMGWRAFREAREARAERRADERVRARIAEALTARGAVRILWVPEDVERPLGALAHLRHEGVEGRVQLEPCAPMPPGMAPQLELLFRPYRSPVAGDAPVVASTRCPAVPGGSAP